MIPDIPIRFGPEQYPINAVSLGMKSIEAPLMLEIEEKYDAAGHAQSQSGHIDAGIDLLPPQITNCHPEIIFDQGNLSSGKIGANYVPEIF